MNELAAIELLSKQFAKLPKSASVELGIGDDCAVIRPPRERLVWTIDASLAGVHFDRRWLSLADVGFRAVSAAVSDLAAMGARPLALLSALGLPPDFSKRELRELSRGVAEAARAHRVAIAGGNISRAPGLSLTTSVLGTAERPLRRDGAKPGERVWLVGKVGLARAGLLWLSRGKKPSSARAAVSAWRRPRALLCEGVELARRASAAIDVSDGLSGDLGHVARASRVRIVLEERPLRAALPRELGAIARGLADDALELALSGGEDYALAATGPRSRRPRFAKDVGRVERGKPGVFLETARGLRPLGGGYDHLG